MPPQIQNGTFLKTKKHHFLSGVIMWYDGFVIRKPLAIGSNPIAGSNASAFCFIGLG